MAKMNLYLFIKSLKFHQYPLNFFKKKFWKESSVSPPRALATKSKKSLESTPSSLGLEKHVLGIENSSFLTWLLNLQLVWEPGPIKTTELSTRILHQEFVGKLIFSNSTSRKRNSTLLSPRTGPKAPMSDSKSLSLSVGSDFMAANDICKRKHGR